MDAEEELRRAKLHKAEPLDASFHGEQPCRRCGRTAKRVPGGSGPVWVHADSGAVVGKDEPVVEDPLDLTKLDLSGLDREELLKLVQRVNDEWDSRSVSSFLEALKEALASDKDVQTGIALHGQVVRATFSTTDYDNGWFFDENSPTLTFEDGTVEDVYLVEDDRSLGDPMANVSQAYQPLGSTATYTVNLLTGEMEQDDYGEAGIGHNKVTETGIVHLGNIPGEQYGWECAACDEVSGLQWGTEDAARAALTRHQQAEPGLEDKEDDQTRV